ncbi:hypothetical protein, partial [Pantoea piersonii]|uniref:hypothetical protein n=1 Tax=Pantoea piersonii TaxID=2364647 RepID=UPI001D565C29
PPPPPAAGALSLKKPRRGGFFLDYQKKILKSFTEWAGFPFRIPVKNTNCTEMPESPGLSTRRPCQQVFLLLPSPLRYTQNIIDVSSP